MSSTESLTDLQNEIFEKINENKTDELKALLATHKIKIDFIDENGMSPLQNACYKDNKEIVQMLLDHGADPNQCKPEHQYTALHFAGLSGNSELCQLLMSYGANMNATNVVGKTAAQMAAFVGNHKCFAAINNFIPKADIDYYIKPQGLQTEPMLQPHLADSFHSFIIQVNVHPVHVIMKLQKFPGLLDNLPMIQKVLEAMRQREMTRTETNEVMAFKYHFFSCVVAEVIKCQKRQEAMKADKIDKEKGSEKKVEEKSEEKCEEKTEEKKSDVIELTAKKFLKCKSDGTFEYQELFLRETIREFHYRESAIFRQMVTVLASSDPPTALSVISGAINGMRLFFNYAQNCVTCGAEKATKKCSKCKQVQYCDRECQRLHWFIHKKTCSRLVQLNTSNVKIPDSNSEQISKAVTSRLENLAVN